MIIIIIIIILLIIITMITLEALLEAPRTIAMM